MPGQRKTFAQALGNTCDIPLSQLPTPCIKGDMIVVWIDEADYLAALGSWKAIPLGKGFYEFEFSSLEVMRWAPWMGSLKLSPGFLRLPGLESIILPLEYWKPRAIFSIIRGLGIPLSLDEHTMRKNRGMLARVLVDIDLLSPLPDHLLVERPNFAFVVDVEYEWLPSFFSHRKMIGHELAQCRVIHDQGHVLGPQHKPSLKTTSDERKHGRTTVPKIT
ncbi:hypothetical protein PHAVU_009G187600 [Phaseolus vulgaris]|uniref:Uncharacterized protein n=1 Tax=Phaseolus vulgaris TaxID=3885 RepID=V7AY32_PHAVU|nr:hypothetical protein PHAVU_009G187600g [Phaseolus vulgaris]ESW10180.1 hypothetical protein PHAVU_009G187600g [Phaseolus vulgaris]